MKPVALRDKDLAMVRRTSDIDLANSVPGATAGQWLDLTDAIEATPIIFEFDVVHTKRAHNSQLMEKIARPEYRVTG
jgi:hypothetical protein